MFSEKLKQIMEERNINLTTLSKISGIGKSSISQYLSGKNEPTEERRSEIAEIFGLPTDYFIEKATEDTVCEIEKIPNLDVRVAAKMLGMNHETVRKGLIQGVFPWGYAIKTSENQHRFFINAKRFAEIEKVKI